jgi:hypothetical protein
MKAISLDRATAFAIADGAALGVMAKRSVPSEIIGRCLVLHAKRGRSAAEPAAGLGYVWFGEALPQLNGDCWWPVAKVEKWNKLIIAPARTGFWVWSYAHG